MGMWKWIDFSYVGKEDKMDSYRASHQLFEFINMFDIEDFKVVQQDGEWQNARIEVVYRVPNKYKADEVEDKWYEYLGNWRQS